MNTLNSEQLDEIFQSTSTENHPTPIYLEGSGKTENGRVIVSIKLTDTLKQHIKNGQISISVIKRKAPSKFGSTHFCVVNQQEWPQQHAFNRNFLALAQGDSKALSFTLDVSQLKTLSYQVPNKGTYIKIEIVDNGLQCGIFRYFKEVPREVTIFKNIDKMVSAKTAKPIEEAKSNPANKEIDDFFKDM